MKKFVQGWLINTLAVLVAVKIVSGIGYEKPLDLLVASLLLGILNAVLRPVLMVLTFPVLLLTLGLFRFVINATLLYFVGGLLRPHFYVDGFGSAFWGALIISVVSVVLHGLTGGMTGRIRIERRRPPPGSGGGGGGSGPVIDI